MKKTSKLLFGLILGIGLIIVFSNCASASPARVKSGKHFRAYYGVHYDQTKTLDEHAVLINLADEEFHRIERINGKVPLLLDSVSGPAELYLETRGMVFLPPGTYTIIVRYHRQTGSGTMITTTRSDSGEFTFNVEAGNTYFLEGGIRTGYVEYSVKNMADVESVFIAGSGAGSQGMAMPSNDVLEGIAATIDGGRGIRTKLTLF